MSAIIIKELTPPPIDVREVSRYIGCGRSCTDYDQLIEKSVERCRGALSYKLCYGSYPLSIKGDLCHLGFAEVISRDLAKCLDGCDGVIVFAATVGLELDRLINRYGRIEPSLSLCLDAIGDERIEALCDSFCAELKEKYSLTRPRFSPGYGDLPLEFQASLFSALSCHKSIGLTLNDSMLMSPAKSVTAIVGVK